METKENTYTRLSSVVSAELVFELVDVCDAVRTLWGLYIAGTESTSSLVRSAEALNVLLEFVDAMVSAHEEEEASRK